jgi:cellulose synthase/poly-beta-1,6-N-acetylglucosamine synthase-like glycosyltransferase
MTEAAFWTAAVALVYAYLGYPALLALVARKGSRPAGAAPPPSVSVIVAAYNEQACIEAKVRNVLEHGYAGPLELIVVSDGSTDATEAIVDQARAAQPRLSLVRQRPRQGKNAALNAGARAARGEVLVFTDANAMLAPGALARLTAPFADGRVGLVSGQGFYAEAHAGATRVLTNAYVRYEQFLKEREAALGFVAAADGALYAMRRALYAELAPHEVHDLMHPIQVARAGGRSAFEPQAFTLEPPSVGGGSEFRRQLRIAAQGLRLLAQELPGLVRAGRLRVLWFLVSHRLLRWTSAAFLAALLVTSLRLADAHPLYRAALAGQAAFYATALAGAAAERLRIKTRLLAVPYYFCLVSAAGAGAFVQVARRRTFATWLPGGGRA